MQGEVKTKAIIFDIGNVLFRIDYPAIAAKWSELTGLNLSEAQIREKFVNSKEHKAFERGEISEEEFAAFASRAVGYEMSLPVFREGWNALLKEVWPGLPNLMKKLKPHYQLVCLSNTNKTHVDAFEVQYQEVIGLLDRKFYSHEVGAIKPQPEIYRAVLDYLQVEPAEAIFFDDLKENIEGARAMGIQGVWVDEYASMKTKLEELLDVFG